MSGTSTTTTTAEDLLESIKQKREEEIKNVQYFSKLRIVEKIKMERSSMQRRTHLAYLIQISLYTVLVGALSFMGAFVFRDFFLSLFKTSLENAGMPRLMTDVIYLVLVLLIAVPALTLVSWAKARTEIKMTKGDEKIE